jgi:hypothetical protein
MVSCDVTRATVRDQLAFLEVGGFRYYKTSRTFLRKYANGTSSIVVNVVSHSPGSSSLAFYLVVRIDDVERKKMELLGGPNPSWHQDCTISAYTVNFGPGSPHWDFPIRGSWSFGSEEEVWAAKPEIEAFTRELSLPYVSRHVDPAEIRSTLLTARERTINLRPYQEILTIDLLYFDRNRLRDDIECMRESYRSMSPEFQSDFERFATVALKA